MNYSDFINVVYQQVRERFEKRGISVEIRKVVKTNDCEKDGLIIRDSLTGAAPTLYLNDLFEFYEMGESITEIADKVVGIYEENKEAVPEEFFNMSEFENARDHITCRVVNRAINEKYLQDIPRVDVLDLSITFYCTCIMGEEKRLYSSKISSSLMKMWGVDAECLYELALKNTPEILGIYLEDVEQVFLDMLGTSCNEADESLLNALHDPNRVPMYILTNDFKNSGAVYMLIGDTLKNLAADLDSDLYIIPSSIHEVLIIPTKAGMDITGINNMVKSVNLDVLKAQDILSDHGYVYLKDENRLVM